MTFATPYEVRQHCRNNTLEVFPSTVIDGYLCLNLVMMDARYADDFEQFCRLNAVACPLIARTKPGDPYAPTDLAHDCDLRQDLRRYDIIRNGVHAGSQQEVSELFTTETVSFLIGSSVSFDGLLHQRGWAPSWGPAIYLTEQACTSVGRFSGAIAVTMRCFPPEIASKVSEFTSHFPRCHGGPIAVNDPHSLGIHDEQNQLLPWPHPIPSNDTKLYWACGITPSRVALQAKLPLMIVHRLGERYQNHGPL